MTSTRSNGTLVTRHSDPPFSIVGSLVERRRVTWSCPAVVRAEPAFLLAHGGACRKWPFS